MERRKNARVKFHVTASVRCGEIGFEHLAIRDLSLTGVYLRGLTGCGVGDRCGVSLFLSGTDKELKLSMQGEVVRLGKNGAGVRFDELDIDTFLHLKNIVYFNADDPDKLEETLVEMPPEGQFVD
ncbi:MAG: PilZ domain-containing protein [Pseudomonadota bacterium]